MNDPELFSSSNYAEKVDVYTFGMLLWEMLTEQLSYREKTNVQVAVGVCKNECPYFPKYSPVGLISLNKSCWTQGPEKV